MPRKRYIIHMDNNFVYIDLIDRFLKGGASPEEEKDLLDWFRKTAPEEVLYAYYRSYWDNAPRGGCFIRSN